MGYFDADAEEMLEVYLLETRQLMEQLNGVLLEADRNKTFSEDDINTVFRIMHTIKSSSAMMGLHALSGMAHKLEDLFSYYREQKGEISRIKPELFDLLFKVSDFVESELAQMPEESYAPKDTKEIENKIEEYLQSLEESTDVKQELSAQEQAVGDNPALQTEKAENKTEPVQAGIPESFLKKNGVVIRVRFEEGCRMENIRAFMIYRQIGNLCSSVESYPKDLEKSQQGAEYINKNGVFIRFESDKKEEVLETVKRGLFVKDYEVLRDEEKKPEPQVIENKKKTDSYAETKEAEFLNVRTDRLDRLQNLSGELLILMLTLDEELKSHGMDDVREGTAYQVNRLIEEMERTVMEMRMVPVSKVIPKLKRILRDICRDQGKEAELIVNCGDIEADKSVVDYVSESLLHIIRNAVDHGLELPKERTEAGKNPKGSITFSAENTIGELMISVTDDGRGIDLEKILEKAREKHLMTKPEEEYDPQEILELILSPGFTTNEEVTEYSGRGVGLDVVKNILEEAGGHLYIQSEAGKGSTFTITLPLSLATIECTRFRVGECRFSVPSRYVQRFLSYEENRNFIHRRNDRKYILYDSRMLPLVDLREAYQIEGDYPDTALLVYVKSAKREGVIMIDSMYEQKRIVVKQLPALFGPGFRRHTGISGCSIMGNGKICAALDIETMIEKFTKEAVHERE
ncbi:chemotaxis protein CheA [Blautia producta]|uniref:Chemotaxis protein CheA n=2 Tax=Lachnospiraceae TaxID=186803 RepID=A0A4P6M274_9FIRM|nr:chemotaxis protein CheA [Blautia producta]QBE98155.1 Chemotaxis protein CheA [Blautia producta]